MTWRRHRILWTAIDSVLASLNALCVGWYLRDGWIPTAWLSVAFCIVMIAFAVMASAMEDRS